MSTLHKMDRGDVRYNLEQLPFSLLRRRGQGMRLKWDRSVVAIENLRGPPVRREKG